MILRIQLATVAVLSVLHTTWSLSIASPIVGKPSTISPVAPSKGTVISSNREALNGKKFPRTWVPLATTYELDPDRPTPVMFLGQKYVTYQDNSKNWVVLDDACPHRLTPLSEGRVDRDKDVLQCSYHGWEFDSSGACTRIPQADAAVEKAALSSKKSCVAAYPTWIEKNVIWIWPWKEDVLSVVGNPMAHPEGMMRDIVDNPTSYTRDLPYGWDTLVENIVDPSHIPFAHHGMQGSRSDAIAINMTVPTSNGEQGFSFGFEDRTIGMMRGGKGEFLAPFVVSYVAEFKTENPKPFDLSVLCIPTKPGWSRIIVTSKPPDDNKVKKSGEKKEKKKLLFKIITKLPVFLIHQLSNRFLDSDLAFLHFQEQERERRPDYFMPAPADRCISSLRTWLSKYTDFSEPLPPAIPRSEMFNRWSQHTSHCKHCQDGLENMTKFRRATYGVLALSIFGFKFRVAKVSTLLCLGIFRLLQKLENSFREGEFKHYKNH